MAASLDNELNTRNPRNGSERAIFYKKPIKRDNYKLDISSIDTPQELRRQRLLQFQKKCRETCFNNVRGILEEAFNSEEDECEDQMEIEQSEKKKYYSHRRVKHYANQLMMSEWMFEVPQDFSENWITVPCPEGKRSLVVACKGITKAYDRRGHRLGKFHSALPGGNSTVHRGSCTILDCLWLKEQQMYYVLDVLAWSNQSLLNCDTEFRFFWLRSQLHEIEALQERNTYCNTFPILPLPNIDCSIDISDALSNLPELPKLDGFLFYHKQGQYTKGRTPLVTWLKSFMLLEVLGIFPPPLFEEKPDGYIDFRHFILHSKAKKRYDAANNSMDLVKDDA